MCHFPENRPSQFFRIKPTERTGRFLKFTIYFRLLLTAATPLLQSRNSAVVIAVINLFLDLAPVEELTIVIQPLVSLATSDRRETKYLSMQLVSQLTVDHPHLIAPYVKHFAVFWADIKS